MDISCNERPIQLEKLFYSGLACGDIFAFLGHFVLKIENLDIYVAFFTPFNL